jgi:hypothetical protein
MRRFFTERTKVLVLGALVGFFVVGWRELEKVDANAWFGVMLEDREVCAQGDIHDAAPHAAGVPHIQDPTIADE